MTFLRRLIAACFAARALAMLSVLVPALAAGLSAPAAQAQQSGAAAPLVVVELFTSQGCNSCPPADALLGELATRPNVLALSMHVDYWDYLGWADPFAMAENTRRQESYQRAMGARTVYTPQIIIQGSQGMVGSRARVVEAAIAAQAKAPQQALVTLRRSSAGLVAEISAVGGPAGAADVVLVTFSTPPATPIERGENRGETILYTNVVNRLETLGTWDGAAAAVFEAEPSESGSTAVIVQRTGHGAILGAALLR